VSWITLAGAPEMLAALGRETEATRDLGALDAAIYAAVLMTLLPGVPPFSTFDVKVRTFLQDLARIPWEAQRLSGALRARTWLPRGDFQERIVRALKDSGFSDLDISFSSDRSPQALWTRITALEKYIESWELRKGKFAGFYSSNSATICQLKDDFENTKGKARRVFSLLKASAARARDPEDALQREIEQAFVITAERLEKDLCDMVSHGVLTCCLTARARRSEFETIGFVVDVTPSHLFDNLLGLYLVLVGFYVLELVAIGRPHPWIMGTVIATMYVGGLVVALQVKRWRSGRPGGDALRCTGYALSAAGAFGFSALTSFALGILMTFDVGEAWRLLTTRSWPWGFMSASVAAVVAYLIDQEERPGRRPFEAAIAAGVCALTAIPVLHLLNQACNDCGPPLWRVMINAGLTGAVIGGFVPTWYRRPQTLVSEYEHHRIVVTTRTTVEGRVVASVDLFPPRPPGGSAPTGDRLADDVDGESAEDVIGEAIRMARTRIDRALTTRRAIAA